MKLAKARKIGAGLTFHRLRHTVATKLADAGADPETIAAVTGKNLWYVGAIYTATAPAEPRCLGCLGCLGCSRPLDPTAKILHHSPRDGAPDTARRQMRPRQGTNGNIGRDDGLSARNLTASPPHRSQSRLDCLPCGSTAEFISPRAPTWRIPPYPIKGEYNDHYLTPCCNALSRKI